VTRGVACLLTLAVLTFACGGSAPGPSPSPSPTALPTPGPVTGPYTLQLTPDPTCGFPLSSLTFETTSADAPGALGPGLQVTLVGDASGVEGELMSKPGTLRGSVGTRYDGALAAEGMQVWTNAIADGVISRATDGRGQVVSGKYLGYIAIAPPQGAEGALGSCSSPNHSFSLLTR
jgi:hypothetical protein